MKKPLILIKIGGSLITDKTKPFTVKEKALKTIAREIKKSFQASDKALIIGHGAGSFAHVPAKKYDTIHGLKTETSKLGMAEVCQVACQLNRIVVNQLLKEKVPAVSVSPFSFMTAKDFVLKDLFIEPVQKILDLKILPVVYGDVIIDQEKGWTIFSTERVLNYLGQGLIKKSFDIEKIIHCGQTNGVYDQRGKTIPLIKQANFNQYRQDLGQSGGIDVTGGMVHKVKESLKMAQKGIPALIIDGIEKGTLSGAIRGEKVKGTRIE